MSEHLTTGTGRDIDPQHLILTIFGALILTALIAYGLWRSFHTQITIGVLALQTIALRILCVFSHNYDQILANVGRAQPQKVSAQTLWHLCTITGTAFLLPTLICLLCLIVLCAARAPKTLFRERYGLEGMARDLARIHPIGKAWVGGNPKLSEPAPVGHALRPMDPALRPEEWLARYAPGTGETTERAAQVFAALEAQLGTRWTDPLSLSAVELALFMAFAEYGARRKAEGLKLLEGLSEALAGNWKKGAIDRPLALGPAYIRRLKSAYSAGHWDDALAIAGRHAFVRPALMSLLQNARRKSGVANPSLFAVVQLVDRDLWLILSALAYPMPGRPVHAIVTTTCTEASAAMEHWRAECIAGSPLTAPQVSRTLTTLFLTEDASREN